MTRPTNNIFSFSSHCSTRNASQLATYYREETKKNVSPRTLFRKTNQRQLILHEILEKTQSERDQAVKLLFALQEKLHRAEAQLHATKKQAEKEQRLHEQNLQYLFFEYLPNNPNNFSAFLGPTQHDIIESKTRIGDYDIVKFIGNGGSSDVFRAAHRVTRQNVALKVMDKQFCADLSALERLEKELRILQFVDHPNIIKLHQVIHAPKNIYIAMDLGHSDAFRYFQKHWDDMNTDALREFALGTLEGIKYLHANGIAHMDIKTENILITKNVNPKHLSRDCVKICDLGLGNLSHDKKGPIPVVHLCGTPGFFAPELALDVKNAEGRACDMWSIGAMLIECTDGLEGAWLGSYDYFRTDESLFQRRLLEAMKAYFNRKQHPDHHLHDLICSLVAWDPTKRPTAAHALSHSWFFATESEKKMSLK